MMSYKILNLSSPNNATENFPYPKTRTKVVHNNVGLGFYKVLNLKMNITDISVNEKYASS